MMRLGCNAEGLGRDHWNEMLAYPRKPIAHWHPLLESKKSEKEVGSGLKSFFFLKEYSVRVQRQQRYCMRLKSEVRAGSQKSDSITESNLNTQTVQKSHI